MKTIRFPRAATAQSRALPDAAIGEFFMRFPLPVALVDRDGNARLMNREYEQRHGPGAIDATCLPQPSHGMGASSRAMPIAARDGSVTLAHVMEVGSDLYALFVEDRFDAVLVDTLARLQSRVSELERQATTDRLTGTWNRAQYERVVEIEINRSNRYRQPVSLILFDVDHFKRINDGFGHDAGDAVLCDLARLVSEASARRTCFSAGAARNSPCWRRRPATAARRHSPRPCAGWSRGTTSRPSAR